MRKLIPYSKNELAWIRENCSLPRRTAHSLFCKKFAREDVTLGNFNALCKRKGWMTGRTGQFKKGNVPDNKGKKMPYNANSARTQFKKGHVPHNAKPSGDERLSKDGYVEMSIDKRNPHTGYSRHYVLKHRYLWEKQNGKIPRGHILKCRDGDRTNTDPSNWELLPRGALPHLQAFRGHDYDAAPAALKPSIMALAKLKHQKKQQEKKAKK